MAVREQSNLIYEFGPFQIDAEQRVLLRDGQPVPLAPKVFDTLLVLVARSGRIVEKSELMQLVWQDSFVEESNLTQNIFTIRKTLGEGRNTERYIETVPRRGYRFVAEVRALRIDNAGYSNIAANSSPVEARREEEARAHQKSDVVLTANDKTHPATGKQTNASSKWLLSLIAITTGCAVVGLCIWLAHAWIARERSDVDAFTEVRTIAVLPFSQINADEGDEHFGVGVADALITKLSNLSQIIVRPTSAVLKYSKQEKDALAAGRELKVEAVLEGSIQRVGERVKVTAQLISVRNGRPLWAASFDERWTDILSLQDRIAEQVARALLVRLTPEQQKVLTKRYITSKLTDYMCWVVMLLSFLRKRRRRIESNTTFKRPSNLIPILLSGGPV